MSNQIERAEWLDLLRRSRDGIEALLGLDGSEAEEFQNMTFIQAEEIAVDIRTVILRAERVDPDPGGVRVRTLVPDVHPPGLQPALRARLARIEELRGRPLRVCDDLDESKEQIRTAILDSILFSLSAQDPTLTALLGTLLAYLDSRVLVTEDGTRSRR